MSMKLLPINFQRKDLKSRLDLPCKWVVEHVLRHLFPWHAIDYFLQYTYMCIITIYPPAALTACCFYACIKIYEKCQPFNIQRLNNKIVIRCLQRSFKIQCEFTHISIVQGTSAEQDRSKSFRCITIYLFSELSIKEELFSLKKYQCCQRQLPTNAVGGFT